jgi:hypothetical protein
MKCSSNIIELVQLKSIEKDVDTAKARLNDHVTTEGKILRQEL